MASTINTRIVLRNDELSAWEDSSKVLLKGEVAFAKLSGSDEFEMRIGTGSKTWNQLSDSNVVVPDSTKFYEKATFAELEAIVGKNGDIGVVKELIADGKYSYTAYRFDKATNGWVALDGNYNASNVIFDEDLTYTTGLGVIAAPSGGSGILTTAGKSVEDLFKQILAKESTSVTCNRQPAQSFTAESSNGGKEVGDTFALTDLQYTFRVTNIGSWDATYKGKTSDGTSTTDTGVRYSAKIVAQDGSTLTSNQSMTLNNSITYTPTATEFPNLTVEDNYKSYTLSAKYTYTGSTSKPVTNLGNFILSGTVSNNGITNITETGTSYDAGLGSINAKTTESTLAATAQFRGYRKMHIVTISSDFTELTEDLIVNSPGLHIKAVANTYDLKAANTTSESNKTIKLVSGTKAVVIALPTTGYSAGRTCSSVLLKSASNTPITESYKEQAQIQISGKVSGQNKAAYKIYMYKPDAIGAGENHTITIG